MRLEFITFIEADGGTMECPTMTTVDQAAKALPELSENYKIEYAVRIVIDTEIASFNCEDLSDEVFSTAMDNQWDDAKDNHDEDTVVQYFTRMTEDLQGRFGRMCLEAL